MDIINSDVYTVEDDLYSLDSTISGNVFVYSDEFEMLNSIGATNRNINKILINECIIVFIKALIISLIISIPIIYKIIEYMKNIIVLQEILIPFANIGIFILALFIVSLVVTINSGKTIKKKIK